MARLKQAKEEAEKEIAAYRAQVESEFQRKLAEVSIELLWTYIVSCCEKSQPSRDVEIYLLMLTLLLWPHVIFIFWSYRVAEIQELMLSGLRSRQMKRFITWKKSLREFHTTLWTCFWSTWQPWKIELHHKGLL